MRFTGADVTGTLAHRRVHAGLSHLHNCGVFDPVLK